VKRLALAVAGALALTACGSSGTPAGRALHDTAKKLGTIRSATIDLRLAATSPAAKGPVGFSMKGPFALPSKAGLPVANVDLTELRGAESSTVRFVSTGSAAYVVRGGKTVALPSSSVSVGGSDGGLGTLRIEKWLRSPMLSDGGVVGGVATDRVAAGLDVAAAFEDLGKLGEKLGTSTLSALRPLDAESRAQLTKAAQSSSIEVWTGKDDRLLRKLVLTVTLDSVGTLPASMRGMTPVTLSLSLDLSAVNEPVHVDAPAA
jgi:hypothetical protein